MLFTVLPCQSLHTLGSPKSVDQLDQFDKINHGCCLGLYERQQSPLKVGKVLRRENIFDDEET